MNVNVTTNGGSSQIAVGATNVVQVQDNPRLTPHALRNYVRHLYEAQVDDVENSTVWEMAENYFGYDLSDQELEEVFDLMDSADVEVVVTWKY